jgi:hypothetical protein
MARRHNLITQVAVLIGAIAGLGAEWLFRPPADRRLFLAAYTAAWLAMGMAAIVTGEVSLNRRSEPVKEWHGLPVRILGVIMSLAAVAMYSWFSSAR